MYIVTIIILIKTTTLPVSHLSIKLRLVNHVTSGLLTAHAQPHIIRYANIQAGAEPLTASWRWRVGDAGRCGFCCSNWDRFCSSSARLDHHPLIRPSASAISCSTWLELEPSTSPSNKLRKMAFFETTISGIYNYCESEWPSSSLVWKKNHNFT